VSRRTALLIVNRNSRQGETDPEVIAELLKSQGIHVIEAFTNQCEDIKTAIHRHRENVDSIVLGGGDGTFNAAAGVLAEVDLPVGLLPMGTANDLARTLGIPVDLSEACQIIAEGLQYRIDLGQVNDHYFFNVAHIGLGVQVARHLSSDIKSRWGVFGYFHALYMAFKKNRPFRARIEFDNRQINIRSIQIAVGNGRHYGGGMVIAANATINDHRLHLYSIKPLNLWSMVRLAPVLRGGPEKDQQEEIDLFDAQAFTVSTRKSMAVYADGEQMTSTPVRFAVLKGAIAVYVPRHSPIIAEEMSC
jgi:YegS/Rv2252/BmrU family lipid kinase